MRKIEEDKDFKKHNGKEELFRSVGLGAGRNAAGSDAAACDDAH